jgi:hypothetical protein
MIVAGYILAAAGSITWLFGEILMLKVAYKQGLGWFFGCLFFPPLWLALLALDFKSAAKPFAITLLGMIATVTGGLMAEVKFD